MIAVATALMGLTGCTSTVSGTAQTKTPSPEENKLEQIMLPIEELKAITGADNLAFTSKTADMNNNFWRIRDEKCLGAMFPAEDLVYLFSYWDAVRTQVAQDPDSDHRHWVQQAAVLLMSEDEARSTLDGSKKWWGKCAGSAIPLREKSGDENSDRVWHIGDLVVDGDLITQTTTRTGTDGWACQRAQSVVGTMTVDAKVCGYAIHGQAATIVNKLVANARR
ncbi:sensor domain-containing protein [Mycolicibacterium sp. 050232]|uniref:sensor domain-containing protein n=1 Tax=Mycolicibacterium sp. 050232 TaxID=3113982 RepID=UPI002E2D74E2|nr:sensor domain-containing protein [Mycolicibacterium sp. 050232]MED5815178.1 sensor domain-containing protein [Mycolicibacterium sp. 050232]